MIVLMSFSVFMYSWKCRKSALEIKQNTVFSFTQIRSTVFLTPFSTWIELRKYSERFLSKCQKQSFADVLQNMSSEKFRKFCTKIPVSQSLYNQVADPRLGLQLDYKETPTQEFSCDTCEIMKNIFFYRTPIWEHFLWLHLQLTYKLKIYFTKVTGKHLWRRLFCK